jgi:hypothetical protein
MNEHQTALRRAARTALTGRGWQTVTPVPGAGGARLECASETVRLLALVRTSANRAVGWMRDDSGALRGLDEAGLVVVAALDDEARPTRADVYGFEPAALRAAYDEMLAFRLAKAPELAKTAPLFIYLDERKPGLPGAVKTRALWTATVKLDKAAPDAGFIERVRGQFARMMGVPADKVVVEFRVTA